MPGQRVLLVEDLATDGRSKVNFVKALREADGKCEHCFVLFFYDIYPEGKKILGRSRRHAACAHHLARRAQRGQGERQVRAQDAGRGGELHQRSGRLVEGAWRGGRGRGVSGRPLVPFSAARQLPLQPRHRQIERREKARHILPVSGGGPRVVPPAERRSVSRLRVASAMPIESSVKGFAGRADHRRAVAHAARRQRDIGGDDDVAFARALGDPIVGDVRPFRHDHPFDQVAARHVHEGVGDHIDLERVALGHPVDLRFDRTGVGIDEEADCRRLIGLFHGCGHRDPIRCINNGRHQWPRHARKSSRGAKRRPARRAASARRRQDKAKAKTKSKAKARTKPAAKPRRKARPPQKFTVSHHREEDFDAGLRAYSAYRDLGLAPATGGMVQAHVIRMTKPFEAGEVDDPALSRRRLPDGLCAEGLVRRASSRAKARTPSTPARAGSSRRRSSTPCAAIPTTANCWRSCCRRISRR